MGQYWQLTIIDANPKNALEFFKNRKTEQISNNSQYNFLRCLAWTSWRAKATTLDIAAMVFVCGVPEYALPAWRKSPLKRSDIALNNTLRTTIGCLKPPPLVLYQYW